MNAQSETYQVKRAEVLPESHTQQYALNEVGSDCLTSNLYNSAVISFLGNGMIFHCSKAAGELLGLEPRKLSRQNIAKLVPELADLPLVLDEQINPYLRFLSMAGHCFEVVSNDGARIFSELSFLSEVDEFNLHFLRVIFHPVRNMQVRNLRHLSV